MSVRFRIRIKTGFAFPRGFGRKNWKRINEGPLKKIGLYARRVEINLIRKDTSRKQTPSKPGKPPKSRYPGHPFKKIFSDVNAWETNVVIGHKNLSGAKQTPMQIHEFGENIRTILTPIPRNRKKIKDPIHRARVRELFKSGRIKSRQLPRVGRTVKMPARPFALPTVRITARKMPEMWRNSVTSATVSK